MKSISRFLKGILLTFCAFGATTGAEAQTLPVCSGTGAGSVYFVSHDSIFKMDPTTTSYTYTGVSMPLGTPNASGLAVSQNLNAASPDPTYYTTLFNGTSRIVQYWNGSSWVSTGTHILNSDHIGGGGGYLFSYDPGSGQVFRYSGGGSATYVGTVGGNQPGGSQDIAVDCSGNFYIIYQGATPAVLKKFAASGTLISTYTLTGTFGLGGGGLAVNGNNVLYDGADGKLYSGVISGTTVNFSVSTNAPFIAFPAADFGSCGYAGYRNSKAATDTFNSCTGATNVTLRATGPGPYNWTVLSGPATITGSGQTVTVSSATTSVIVHNDADCSGNNTIVDTNVIFVGSANISAGPDRTIYSCGQFVSDSIRATISNTSPGNTYAFSWTINTLPPNFIVGSSSDTVVHYQINTTTTFYLDVYTVSGCHFYDTTKVTIIDSTPKANFTFIPHYGCDQDTVCFFNTSYGGIDSFAWFFWGDSAVYHGLNNYDPIFPYYYTDAVSPCNIFRDQGFYPVRLLAKNAYCQDTVTKLINLDHPLKPEFAIDGVIGDTANCSDHVFAFKDQSKTPQSHPDWPFPAVTYKYDFGDGTTSNLSITNHKFPRAGTYVVTLTLTDRKLGCTASVKHTVVVDSVPFARIISPDTIICQGQAVHLHADYLKIGNTGIDYNLGDGSTFQNTDDVNYAFTEPGTYNVVLTAHYRHCPSATYSYPFSVRPFPGINLGPDTVLCPNGAPIILSDRVNLGNTAARYLWNTGETTAAIAARGLGTYWARVNIGGCTATDSIVINKDCYVSIPNSFTPNGDGTNDYFLPRQYLSRSVTAFKMSIFNRWGEKVFETVTTDGRGWDGKFNGEDQPLGVYVYMIDVTFDNGVKEHYTGNLTLLR